MEISQVLTFMSLEYVLRGDGVYSDSVDINSLNIELMSGTLPSNESFHLAAVECKYILNINAYTQALQSHLDDTARAKQYDSALSVSSYIDSTVSEWRDQAIIFSKWRDECWQYAITVEAEVKAGTIPPPTVDDFIAGAPVMIW